MVCEPVFVISLNVTAELICIECFHSVASGRQSSEVMQSTFNGVFVLREKA